MSLLNRKFSFLAPLEVVKVTSETLEEAALWCGGTIHETESRRVKGRMDKYILVPTPKGNATSWAFPGMYITKRLAVTEKDTLKPTYSVFRRDYFERNCFDTPQAAALATWERAETEKISAREKSAVESAMADALAKQNQPGAIVEQRETAREELVETEEVLMHRQPEDVPTLVEDANRVTRAPKRITGNTGAA